MKIISQNIFFCGNFDEIFFFLCFGLEKKPRKVKNYAEFAVNAAYITILNYLCAMGIERI